MMKGWELPHHYTDIAEGMIRTERICKGGSFVELKTPNPQEHTGIHAQTGSHHRGLGVS